VQKTDHLAFGSQGDSNEYDDSYAYLAGFPPDVSAQATIHLKGPIPDGDNHEVELLLRWSDAAHAARGYECSMAHYGAITIIRWNGAMGDFTVIPQTIM